MSQMDRTDLNENCNRDDKYDLINERTIKQISNSHHVMDGRISSRLSYHMYFDGIKKLIDDIPELDNFDINNKYFKGKLYRSYGEYVNILLTQTMLQVSLIIQKSQHGDTQTYIDFINNLVYIGVFLTEYINLYYEELHKNDNNNEAILGTLLSASGSFSDLNNSDLSPTFDSVQNNEITNNLNCNNLNNLNDDKNHNLGNDKNHNLGNDTQIMYEEGQNTKVTFKLDFNEDTDEADRQANLQFVNDYRSVSNMKMVNTKKVKPTKKSIKQFNKIDDGEIELIITKEDKFTKHNSGVFTPEDFYIAKKINGIHYEKNKTFVSPSVLGGYVCRAPGCRDSVCKFRNTHASVPYMGNIENIISKIDEHINGNKSNIFKQDNFVDNQLTILVLEIVRCEYGLFTDNNKKINYRKVKILIKKEEEQIKFNVYFEYSIGKSDEINFYEFEFNMPIDCNQYGTCKAKDWEDGNNNIPNIIVGYRHKDCQIRNIYIVTDNLTDEQAEQSFKSRLYSSHYALYAAICHFFDFS